MKQPMLYLYIRETRPGRFLVCISSVNPAECNGAPQDAEIVKTCDTVDHAEVIVRGFSELFRNGCIPYTVIKGVL